MRRGLGCLPPRVLVAPCLLGFLVHMRPDTICRDGGLRQALLNCRVIQERLRDLVRSGLHRCGLRRRGSCGHHAGGHGARRCIGCGAGWGHGCRAGARGCWCGRCAHGTPQRLVGVGACPSRCRWGHGRSRHTGQFCRVRCATGGVFVLGGLVCLPVNTLCFVTRGDLAIALGDSNVAVLRFPAALRLEIIPVLARPLQFLVPDFARGLLVLDGFAKGIAFECAVDDCSDAAHCGPPFRFA